MITTTEKFVFYSRLHLIELTGIVATTIPELVAHLKTVSGASIYHHTHHFVQRHQYLSPEPANDFAYWVTESLGDNQLGEELASIDVMSYPTVRAIREAIINTLETALRTRSRIKNLSAQEGEGFSFLKSVSFVFPTEQVADDLRSFEDCLKNVSLSSIYYHMFEARLRLERPTNDFSNWLSTAVDEKQLAIKIAKLDPYTLTGESLRAKLLSLVGKRLVELEMTK